MEKLLENSPLHFTLIDPDEQSPERAGEIAREAERGGTDCLMVGGSIGSVGSALDKTLEFIKEKSGLPVILFPQDHGGLSPKADAVFFMSMLNSRNPMYISGFQMMGAPLVKKYGLETLPMAYLLVEPAENSTAGYVSDAKPIPRDKPKLGVAYSLAAQFMGMDIVYLEGGSGVSDPVPLKLIRAVKEKCDLKVIVGGGIRSAEDAYSRVKAGADVIVTGTAVEGAKDVESSIKTFTEAIR